MKNHCFVYVIIVIFFSILLIIVTFNAVIPFAVFHVQILIEHIGNYPSLISLIFYLKTYNFANY